MTREAIQQGIITIFAAFGGISVVLLAIMKFGGGVLEKSITTKLTAQQNIKLEEIKNQYTVDIERLRADLSRQRDVLSQTTAALSSSYSAAHVHIIETIKDIWSEILAIDEFASPYLFIHSILIPSEIEEIDLRIKPLGLPKMTDEEFHEKAQEIRKLAIVKRPFTGERLWQLYHVYQLFSMRLCLKMNTTQNKNNRLYLWNKDMDGKIDSLSLDALGVVLSKEELESVYKTSIGAPSMALNLIKNKILAEMNELIFGKKLIAMNIEEQRKIANLLQHWTESIH